MRAMWRRTGVGADVCACLCARVWQGAALLVARAAQPAARGELLAVPAVPFQLHRPKAQRQGV